MNILNESNNKRLEELAANFDNIENRRLLMQEFGNSDEMYHGVNENNESVTLSINPDSLIVNIYQDNGWIRVHEYDEDGYVVSEYYEKG